MGAGNCSVACVVGFALLAQGCAAGRLSQANLLSKAEERRIGKEVVAEVQQRFRVLEDPYLQAYLKGMGDRLARAMAASEFELDFHVVADPRINAFAVPGGHVFVTTQTLLVCQDESELAGVVAHEIGHAEARHLAYRMEKATRVNLAALGAVLAGVFLGGGSQAGAAVTSFALAGAQTKMLQYSRDDEEDADRRAVRALQAAGYDPWGMVRFMEIMRRESPAPEGVPAYLFTHPLPDNRSVYLAESLGPEPILRPTPADLGPLWQAQARVLAEDPRPWGLRLLERRVQENPGSADARIGLAIALRSAGRFEDALRVLAEARILRPDDPELVRQQASLLLRQGRVAEAEGLLGPLRAQGKADVLGLRELGWAYLEAEEGAKALAVYDELAQQDPSWDRLRYYRALALGKAGRTGEAHALLGDYYRDGGRHDLAERQYREALKDLRAGEERVRVQQALSDLARGASAEEP